MTKISEFLHEEMVGMIFFNRPKAMAAGIPDFETLSTHDCNTIRKHTT